MAAVVTVVSGRSRPRQNLDVGAVPVVLQPVLIPLDEHSSVLGERRELSERRRKKREKEKRKMAKI
jgi:hypothetical protein